MFQEVCHNNVSTWSFQLNPEKFKPLWQTYEEEVRKESSCVFLGESENGFVISDHVDSSLPKKNWQRI